MQTKIITVVLCAFLALSGAQEIKISLSARDLVSGDLIWGSPDPSIKIGYAIGSNPFSQVGETAVLHTNNPVWTEIFRFQFVEHLDQRLQFEVIENDAFFNDKYGTVTIPMKDLLPVAAGATVSKDFGKGVLQIKKLA